MAWPEQLQVLQGSELFEGVDAAAMVWLGERLHAVEFSQGETIFEQGDAGDAVYVILRGEVSLRAENVDLAVRSKGEVFGEFALIDDGPRSADAVARTNAQLMRWERDDFQQSIRQHPEVASGVFKLLTAKLRENVQQEVRLRLEQERWRQDLERAREIQAGMLPAQDLQIGRLAVCGRCRPAEAVGGDFFDFFPGPDDSLGIVICDVTGHGFYAGLFVAMVKSALRNQAQRSREPVLMMDAARQALDLSLYKLLMSCCYILIEPKSGRLRYANAGHPPPLLRRARNSSLEELAPLDPILGVFEAAESEVSEVNLPWQPNDRVLLYTDGITEFKLPRGEFLGVEFLARQAARHAKTSPREICEAIWTELDQMAGEAAQRDDVTLVVAGDTSGQGASRL